VAPSGGKWWRFKYRYANKEKRLSFGTFPDVSLIDAREKRDEARKQLANGVDPGAHRKVVKLARVSAAANTFEKRVAHLKLPGSRMKMKQDHIVPLAKQAVEILHELHPLTGQFEFVFPGARSPRRPMSDNAVLFAMRRMDIAKETMSGHGFRAMVRTILDEVLGCRVDLIAHQLAHAVKDVNGRAYNRTSHLPERRKMMQSWANYLDGLRSGAKVIPFKRGA